MIFVVALLMKSLAANVAHKWLIPGVNANMSVQRRRSVESFSANVTLVRFFFGVDDFVPAERACLPETLAAYLTLEWPSASVYWHVPCQVVMRVENLAANFAGEGFGRTVTPFTTNRTSSGTRHGQ